jgi:hypothetical protein
VAEISSHGGEWVSIGMPAPATGRIYAAVHEAEQRVLIISDQEAPAYWDYASATWAAADQGDVPSPRMFPAITYDAINRRILVYGGIVFGGSSNPVADVYAWDGMSWVQLDDAASGPRAGHRMAYVPSGGRILVHGGVELGNPFGGRAVRSTWTIEPDGTWQDVGAMLPDDVAIAGMAYDETRDTLVVAGGTRVSPGGYGLSDDVWELRGSQWNLAVAATPVGPRVLCSLEYSPERGGLLLYGSEHAGWNDLWLYRP